MNPNSETGPYSQGIAGAEERRGIYRDCLQQLEALLQGEDDLIVRMASVAAVFMQNIPAASFIGFYRRTGDDTLVIGPYQGPPACLRIRLGQGVCGAAAASGRPLLVPDVHEFPGHIACDPLSRSELVLPVRDSGGELIGVLDLDSRLPAAFDLVDQEELAAILARLFGPA